jgi:hypothetical protein
MNAENRNCQNCKNLFVIEPDDFTFYDKINVPAPTFCPDCRLQRRLMFRNERNLYKRKCGLCDKNILSIFSEEGGLKVYCGKCWWSDEWEGTDYGIDYNPNRNFFEQYLELRNKTPFQNLIVDYQSLVNSEYVNHAGALKNCHLIFNADYCENVYNSSTIVQSRECAEMTMTNNSELSYECIAGDGSQRFFSDNCPESLNVWYSKDCHACTNCFGCVNLRNRSNVWFNEQLSKEEWQTRFNNLGLDKYSTHKEIQKNIYKFWLSFPKRFSYERLNFNSSGEYIYNSKNSKNCYQAISLEDSKYCQFITIGTTKECYDVSEWGHNISSCVDSITVGEGVNGSKYCAGSWNNCSNVEYAMYCVNLSNCFGCINLRKKEYCILNKQYSKEEYFILRKKIIEDLEKNPYIDKMGRVFKYGEFLPYDLSPFCYNESYAIQYFDLNKEEILNKGFKYTEKNINNITPTLDYQNIPDSINDINISILDEILSCVECSKPYKIGTGEFDLLKKLNLPIPRNCADCRHNKRMSRLNMPFFYSRNCAKCNDGIFTSYNPDGPEIVYCEKCYQQEII